MPKASPATSAAWSKFVAKVSSRKQWDVFSGYIQTYSVTKAVLNHSPAMVIRWRLILTKVKKNTESFNW